MVPLSAEDKRTSLTRPTLAVGLASRGQGQAGGAVEIARVCNLKPKLKKLFEKKKQK
ncbi:MAG: hypothetical protein AB1393_01290 [Candidatus Edwardsbacteria bacterium]